MKYKVMMADVGSKVSDCIDTFTHSHEAEGLKEQLEDISDDGVVVYVKSVYGEDNE